MTRANLAHWLWLPSGRAGMAAVMLSAGRLAVSALPRPTNRCDCMRPCTRQPLHPFSRQPLRQRARRSMQHRFAAEPGKSSSTAAEKISAAEATVNQGLEVFHGATKGVEATREALALFQKALEMQPSSAEAQAAYYNIGCCHVRLQQWQEAVDAIKTSINEYGVPYKTAQEDKDLAPLRERREWLDAVGSLRGNISDKSLVQLRTEAKAPFRLIRLILASGLLFGAGVGLIIIATRLVQSLQGGEGAPDLPETLKNLAINGAAVAGLGFIVQRDLASSQRDKKVVEREESLARLLVAVGRDRQLPLASFRETTRPVLLAGSRSWLKKALAAAEPYRDELRDRGVSVVPLPSALAKLEDDPAERLRALKQEFGAAKKARPSKGFGSANDKATPEKLPDVVEKADGKERKWSLEPVEVEEWLQWVDTQLTTAGIEKTENVFVQVSLDGTVRSSGLGIPPWRKFVDDLAPLDDVRTRLTRQ